MCIRPKPIVFLALLFVVRATVAQDTTNTIGHVSIASPTAASLGKYGDIPVSYNTGTPQISIPVYTVQAGSLKLPVSLSYHASGLKVQENASWVGAGWALNAGGVVTRTVVGAPDDRGVVSYNNCTNGYYSDYGYNSYQFISGSGPGSVNGMIADDRAFELGAKDGEPDLYFFNFGSYSGKFYFNDDRTPILLPEQDFKIQPDLVLTAGNLGFQGFVITTPDGVKYYFGKTGNSAAITPVEITTPVTLQNAFGGTNQAVSSWFLNKIVSADGMDSISLTYQKEDYSFYTLSMSPISNAQTGQFLGPVQSGYNVVKNFVNGVRLTGISFPNGNINFTRALSPRTDLAGYANQGFNEIADTTSYALGSISISDNNGFCKKDSFYYGYFYDATAFTLASTYNTYNIHSDQYRLRLDSMQELTCDNSLKIPPYKFSYFTEQVPRKLSFGIDHWGFSNGVTNNTLLIPSYTLFNGPSITQFTGANRDAVWPAMRGGALQQITYPTGGNTQFVFESHDTYCNYNTYARSTDLTEAVGYSGNTFATGSFTTSSTSTTFVVDLSNNNVSTGGNYEIVDAGNNIIQNFTSAANSTTTFYCTLSPSTTYTIKLYDNALETGGHGITGVISDWRATPVQGNVTVGGLRIKTITNNDGMTANNMVTSYSYNAGSNQSSGILYSRPVYVQSIRNDVFALIYASEVVNGCQTPSFISPLGNGGTYYLSSGSITPMATFQGNHIGYNQVQVSQANNGYSIYRYYGSAIWDNIISDVCTRTIDVTTCALSIPNFPAPPQPYEFVRGELKYEGHFNQNGQVIKDASYSYTYAPDPIQTPGVIYITIPGLYSNTTYNLQSSKKLQTQVTETQYDPNSANAVTTTNKVYYGSAFHHEATRKVMSTSTADSLVTNVKYAFDFRCGTCDAIPDSLPFYNSAVHTDSIYWITQIGSCPLSGWTCRYDSFQFMRRAVNLDRIQYISYRKRSFSDPGNLFDSYHNTAENASDTLLKPIYRLQDQFNNPPIETSGFKDLNLLQASFTKYDTSLSPVGFAYPARTRLVSLQSPSGTFTNAAVSGNTIAMDGRYIDESFYKFSLGNPAHIIPHSGTASAYIWDYLNTEPVAKVFNATIDQVAYTSFEADGKGSWVFSGVPITDTSSPTGSKCYNMTSGNITRAGVTSTVVYVVSYWSKTGASFSVTGSTSVKAGKTIDGWTYYEHTVTGVSSITVSGAGNLDELRLYPATAEMNTYTYSPLQGMTCSCDADNKISYYFYDGLGRLKWIKDQDRNMIKTIQYHYNTITGFQY